MVRECEIQLPVSVQENQGLTDDTNRYVRGIKGEEPFVEEEDREKYLTTCRQLLEWEEKVRQEAKTALIQDT